MGNVTLLTLMSSLSMTPFYQPHHSSIPPAARFHTRPKPPGAAGRHGRQPPTYMAWFSS